MINILLYEPNILAAYGGNQTYIRDIYKYLDHTRYHLIFATPFNCELSQEIEKLGFETLVIPPPNRLNQYGGTLINGKPQSLLVPVYLLAYSLRLVRTLRQKKIQVVQCHSLRSLLTVGLAVKLAQRKCFWYIKGELDEPILDRIGFSLANVILFQSETNKNKKYPNIIRKNVDKIKILSNGIDLNKIVALERKDLSTLRAKLAISEDNTNIVFVGAIRPPKGVRYLLEAIISLKNKYPCIKLFLVGESSTDNAKQYKQELSALINEHGLAKWVTFTGWRADVLDIVSLMDIFVLPTLSEGFPKSVIEAMALGKPVITTDNVGGIPELVSHGETGLLVQPQDSQGIAVAITTLLEDRKLMTKLGEQARQVAFAQYSIQKNISGLQQVYKDLVNP